MASPIGSFVVLKRKLPSGESYKIAILGLSARTFSITGETRHRGGHDGYQNCMSRPSRRVDSPRPRSRHCARQCGREFLTSSSEPFTIVLDPPKRLKSPGFCVFIQKSTNRDSIAPHGFIIYRMETHLL